MKKKSSFVLVALLCLCSAVFADQIAIGTAGGNLYLRSEADLSVGQTSAAPLGVITSMAANRATGDIVVATSESSWGELHSFNASNISTQISAAAAFAQGATGLAVDSSGNIIAAGKDGSGKPTVMHRQIPHVENGAPYPYIYLTLTNGAETPMVTTSSTGTFFVGLTAPSTMTAYNRTLSWDRTNGSAAYDDADLRWGAGDTLGAIAATSQGYLLFAEQMGAYSRIGIRDNVADGVTRFGFQSVPAGYDAYTTYSNQGGWFEGVITALAVTANDNVVIGFADGTVAIRAANDLETPIVSAVLGNSISALAVTANGNIVIGTTNGKIALFSSNLTDLNNVLWVGNAVTALAVVPEPATMMILSIGGLLAIRRKN
ncbi:MAG: PEP-CTERM sorting domain-containing protein [Sedimentisphaerales bacterium]